VKRYLTGVGIDAAFANMGFARVLIDLEALLKKPEAAIQAISVEHLELISTVGLDKKTVRKSSDDLRRAKELFSTMQEMCKGADFAFAEVPSGSLSASAARSLGIAVGVLAGCPIQMIEVSQLEVKMALYGTKTATKMHMINSAVENWPDANWLRVKRNKLMKLTNDNEHLADACGAVVAGIQTSEFKRLLVMLKDQQRDALEMRGLDKCMTCHSQMIVCRCGTSAMPESVFKRLNRRRVKVK
jgi:hypothetical protein